MNCGNLIDATFPSLQVSDPVSKARDYVGQEHSIVLLQDQHFKGVIDTENLEHLDDSLLLESCVDHFSFAFVNESDFFLAALRKMSEQHLSCVPVLSLAGEYMGVITRETIVEVAAQYLNAGDPGGVIILQMLPHQFSISELGRIVESNNAKILHLTTWTDLSAGSLMVSMKVNKIDIQDILASFERYQFSIYQYFGENLSEDTLKSNFDNLMNYLKM